MAEQKVNSNESNDDDGVFNNPDDLDLETVRRVKDALESHLKSFYGGRLDNTAARQQKQIIKYAWHWAMRKLFITALFSNHADQWDLVEQFIMEEEDDRLNIAVFCYTCPGCESCDDDFCRYYAYYVDGDGYVYNPDRDDNDDSDLPTWLNGKSKAIDIDSLDDGVADADDGPVKKVQQEVVSKASEFFDDDDEVFDSLMEMPVDDGADAGTN